jgi:hypothetical protein
MIKIRYDVTGGQFRRMQKAAGVADRSRRRVASGTGGGGGGGGVNRYSPVFERAEDPTLADNFLPADPQTQNKLWRQIITMDPIAGPATEYWKEMAFGEKVILSGIDDEKVEQFYYDAIEACSIEGNMADLLGNYLQYGSFVFHMTMDESKGYWDEVIVDDLDFLSITVSPIPSQPPIIDLQPTQEDIAWATNPDPRFKEQRRELDPVLVKLLAMGQPIPLAPENTMFLPRKAYAEDRYGTSYLTRILPFWIYEKALMDASVQGARRKAGPLYLVTAWENAAPSELNLLDEMFAAAEEDPVGGRVVTRDGVNVNPIGGGGGDIWKWSDELDILSNMKMRALGISETFLNGEATYNSMETVLSVFLQKLKSVRSLFTRKIIQEKILKQLAQNHGFYKRPKKQLRHGYRIARSDKADADLQLPGIEWDEPLEPVADREYFDMLTQVEEKGIVIPLDRWAQAAGYDMEKYLETKDADLEKRKEMLAYRRAMIEQREEFGFDAEGMAIPEEETFGEEGGAGGLFGGGFGEEGGGLFGEEGGGEGLELGGEEGGLGELGGEEGGGAPGTGALEGFGADSEHARFPYHQRRRRIVTAGEREALPPPNTKKRRRIRRPKEVTAEVVTRPGHDKNIAMTLGQLPLWDAGDTLFGLRRRHAAKILDHLERTDPHMRDKTARSLPAYLRKREGLTNLQAEAATYLAMRLGYIPRVALSTDTYESLGRYVTSQMNGHGLTKPITQELMALSATMQEAGRREPDLMTRLPMRETTRKQLVGEKDLGHSSILTGKTE